MKILLVHDYAIPMGGAEIQVLGLRDALRQRGHDARLFATTAGLSGARSVADYECFGTVSRFRTLLQSANPWAYRRLRRVLAEFQPDVVHVTLFLTQLSPLILPLLKRVPALYFAVWYRAICPLGTKMLPNGISCTDRAGSACIRSRCLPWRDWLPVTLQMRLLRRWRPAFDLVVAVSESVGRHLAADGFDVKELASGGVPVVPARPPLAGPPLVAFAGRLVPEKGVDVLVRAFAQIAERIPEAQLLVVGGGAERLRLARQVAELGLSSRVRFTGHLSCPEMESLFSTVWVQAIPSRWEEPFGNVAAEAMMRGTAVVASGAGGLAGIVQEGQTGFLVPPDNADALADALTRLLKDRPLAERMGQAGRTFALERLGEAAFVDRFVALYGTLVQRGR